MNAPSIPEHITVDEGSGKADCAVCKTGITAPPSFGGILRPNLLASFVVLHSVHSKGRPSGLTPGGRARQTARDAMRGTP